MRPTSLSFQMISIQDSYFYPYPERQHQWNPCSTISTQHIEDAGIATEFKNNLNAQEFPQQTHSIMYTLHSFESLKGHGEEYRIRNRNHYE